jgi:peptidyl-prolyl cis-trans isomerase A (cyclophilin A)
MKPGIRTASALALGWALLWGQEPEKPKPQPAATRPAPRAKREAGTYATLVTSAGRITCRLYEREAPKAVANFIGLSEGTKEWTHPGTKEKMKVPLYSGTVFWNVVPGFMIQGGDPLGDGTGNPGYRFDDEFSPHLKFDRPGRLAMANSTPNAAGSQFFITEVKAPHLDNKHTIFGQCDEGKEVISKIAAAGKGKTILQRVVILRVK